MQLANVSKTLFQGTSGATAPIYSGLVGGKDGSGNLQPLAVSAGGVLSVTFSGDNTVVGKADADAAVAGNPVYIGGYGSTATPTAMSADGDMTPLWLTRNGAVNIADGGGTITVDGTVTANAGTGFAAVATAGSAVVTTGYMNELSDGTNARHLLGDTSGRQIMVGAAATDAVVAGNPVYVGGLASTATPAAVSADGDAVALWLTRNGALNIADAGGSITVDGSVTVSGTVTSNAGTGFAAVATAGSAVVTTGYMMEVSDGTNARHAAADTSGRQIMVGAVAADAVAAGNPVYVGGYASTATPTAMSADGDSVPFWLTRNGALNIADAGGSITVDGSVSITGTPAVTLPQASSFSTTNNTSVANTATAILASNSGRKGFIISNHDATNSVWVGGASVAAGGSAGANKGVELGAGGVITSSMFASFTGAISGITTSGTAVVGVLEW